MKTVTPHSSATGRTNVILFTQQIWALKFNNKEQIDNTFI